ncbi:MAG: hypothetical protein ABIJ56_17950 [Pseudomonadota bacterium]
MKKSAAIILVLALILAPAALWAKGLKKGMGYDQPYASGGFDVDMPDLGGGEVKLPWNEFSKVLEEALGKNMAGKKKPPVGYTVDHAAYVCETGENEAIISAKFNIWVLDEGYSVIPIFRGDIAVEKTKFIGAKAALTEQDGWISVVAAGPATFSVEVTGRAKVSTDHGMKVVRLDVPQAGSSTLTCDIAMKGASVKLTPGVVTSRQDSEKGVKVSASLFPHGYVDIRWWEEVKLPGEEKKKEKPRLFATMNTLLSVGEGLVLGRSVVDYSIVQGEVEELEVLVPNDIVINNVTGTELKDWSVDKKDGSRILSAFLSYKVSGSYSLTIEYEKSMGKTSAVVKAPELKVLGVERETGFFGVAARTNVEISAEDFSGVTQIDPKEAQHYVISSSPRPVLLAYKYLKHPFDIVLDVKKHFDVSVLIAAIDMADIKSVVTEDGKYLTAAVFLVRNNMKQFLKVELPDESEVWSTYVAGKPVKPGKDKKGRILVPLENSQQGPGDMASFAVEVVYLSRIPEMEKKGRADLKLLKVDIPVSHMQWSLFLPEKYRYRKFDGNVEKATQPLRSLPQDKLQPVYGGGGHGMLQSIPQANVMEIQNMDFELLQKEQSMDIGVMPVKMEIPQQGQVFHFTKLLVIDERPELAFDYKKKWEPSWKQ